MPNVSMSIRTVTKMKTVAARRLGSIIVHHRKPQIDGAVDARAIVRREQVEQEAAETGDEKGAQRARALARIAGQAGAGVEGLEPFVHASFEKAGKARRIAQRQRIDLEREARQRFPFRLAPLAPQRLRHLARWKIGQLETRHHLSLPSPAAANDLDNELLLRAEVVE